MKWLRPLIEQFNNYFRHGADQTECKPNFAAAASEMNLLIEIKKAAETQTG